VLVPLVVVALVLVNVLRPDDDTTGGPVADVSGTPSSGRDDLPVLDVDTPEVTPAADLACPVLMQQLPPELAGEPSRMVRSDSPYAYAWGDPAIVLICGVAPPAGYVVGARGGAGARRPGQRRPHRPEHGDRERPALHRAGARRRLREFLSPR
jgi:hypothetical protein